MGRKHCGKGEIARYEQFLLFPQCFQQAYFPGHQKVSLYGNALTNHSQETSLSISPRFCEFESTTTSKNGFANQKLCYISNASKFMKENKV